MTDTQERRAGFAAIVGRPNVGKSTLVNQLVGQKVSITTPRPQTTRHRVLGLVHRDNAQLALIDTPGLHGSAGKALNRRLNQTAQQALYEADVIVWMTEAGNYRPADDHVLGLLAEHTKPVVAVLNKSDRIQPRTKLLAELQQMTERREFAEIVPISALKADNTDRLLSLLLGFLPNAPFYYDTDAVTDRPVRFLVAEIIREKLTLRLENELPYGITVTIEEFKESETPVQISATIVVPKRSHKAIVIGKGGQKLKEVGSAARRSIEGELGQRVHLDLWVRVRENWADNEQELNRLGFD